MNNNTSCNIYMDYKKFNMKCHANTIQIRMEVLNFLEAKKEKKY